MQYTYVHSKRLKVLRPVLEEWVRLNILFAKRSLWKDCAWWSNERASTGILAAAAWTAGSIAIEEYTITKRSKQVLRSGRCDLCIDTGVSRFACEAKQVFTKLRSGSASDMVDIEEALSSACHDARQLSPQEGRRLGICFVSPRYARSQISSYDCLVEYLANIQKLKFDAIAWCFPEKARHMVWPLNNRIYPGGAVLIREVFKRV